MGVAVEFEYKERNYNEAGTVRKTAKWEDLVPLHEDPEGKGVLARIHTPTDVVTFGEVMHHCAHAHQLWVQSGNWIFAGVFDDKWVPHLNVFAQRVEENTEATAKALAEGHKETMGFAFNGYTLDAWAPSYCSGVAKPPQAPADIPPEPSVYTDEWYQWRTKYRKYQVEARGRVPVLIDGEPCIIVQAYDKGGSAKNTEHWGHRILKTWFEANKIEGAELVIR